MPFICDSYRTITTKILSIHFNNLFLFLLISLETTTPHVRRVLLYSRFYIHTFLQLLFCKLNSPTMLIFVFIHIICLLCLQLQKRSIHKKWLFFTTYFDVYSMLSQLKLFFLNRNPYIFPQKSTWSKRLR